jgi:hypothetical protein
MICRFCRSTAGEVVLDLGCQPAGDDFPLVSAPGPDSVHPLRMWLCAACHLAQLVEDPTTSAEPRGVEPEALLRMAEDAVSALAAAGFLRPGAVALEYGSPHGGSWQPLLRDRGLRLARTGDAANVIIDNIGMMHDADQAAALRERVDRLAPGGVLFLLFHSFATIVRRGQWNALRHGHFAYYSTPALIGMLNSVGLSPVSAQQFPLYGGSVLLGATVDGIPDDGVAMVVKDEVESGVLDTAKARGLQLSCSTSAESLRAFLVAEKAEGRRVVGYSAASRAVALLCRAGIGPELMSVIGDTSPAKAGRRMPGSAIPIVDPTALAERKPDTVVLFVPDLIDEVRRAMPEVEAAGGCWVKAEG